MNLHGTIAQAMVGARAAEDPFLLFRSFLDAVTLEMLKRAALAQATRSFLNPRMRNIIELVELMRSTTTTMAKVQASFKP